MSQSGVQSDLQLYLRQINEVPLLTPEEERELGWRIINDNDFEAKDRMIRANLRLVVSISKNYSHRGLPLSVAGLDRTLSVRVRDCGRLRTVAYVRRHAFDRGDIGELFVGEPTIHRFSTVRMADRILVLDDGRVIEDGSHDQLLRLGGRYAELFNLQAEGYR